MYRYSIDSSSGSKSTAYQINTHDNVDLVIEWLILTLDNYYSITNLLGSSYHSNIIFNPKLWIVRGINVNGSVVTATRYWFGIFYEAANPRVELRNQHLTIIWCMWHKNPKLIGPHPQNMMKFKVQECCCTVFQYSLRFVGNIYAYVVSFQNGHTKSDSQACFHDAFDVVSRYSVVHLIRIRLPRIFF